MKWLIVFSTLVLTGCFSSQNFPKGLSSDEITPGHDVKVRDGKFFFTAYTNNVRAAVIADFLERFGEVPNVSWYVDEKEVSAYFIKGNDQITVQYQPDGLHLQTKKNYDGANLDSRVSELLQRELGKKFSLNLVTEVIKDTHACYEVSLYSKTQLYFVRIYKNLEDESLVIADKTLLKRG